MAKKTSDESAASERVVQRANINRVEAPRSPDFASIYANDAQIQLTPWDIRLIFGVIASVPTEENPGLAVQPVGEVRLSLPLAKKIVAIVGAQLQHYEATAGLIPMPED